MYSLKLLFVVKIKEEVKPYQRLWVIIDDRIIPRLRDLGIESLFTGFTKVDSKAFHGLQLSLLTHR